MPLLKRKPHELVPAPRDIQAKESLFVVRLTGEIFRDYELYLKQVHAYRTKQWTCKYTGKSNLSYEEALAEEARSTELLSSFPPELEESFIKVRSRCMDGMCCAGRHRQPSSAATGAEGV
jgi:bromodomain adjacent to zinc finger domain protein 1A